MYMYTHLIVIVLLYHSVRYHENRFKNKHVMVQTKTGGVNFFNTEYSIVLASDKMQTS